MTSIASQSNHGEADRRNIDNAKISNVKVNDLASTSSGLPADDPHKALRELDRRQAEENRKIDAALAICHC